MNARAQPFSRCEANGVCLDETHTCVGGQCAQAAAARVYADLNLPLHERAHPVRVHNPDQDDLLEKAHARIQKLDDSAIFMALWFGFCCVLFWLVFVGSILLVYRADAAIRAFLRDGIDQLTQLIQWVLP
jgi:hypothetical protein